MGELLRRLRLGQHLQACIDGEMDMAALQLCETVDVRIIYRLLSMLFTTVIASCHRGKWVRCERPWSHAWSSSSAVLSIHQSWTSHVFRLL